MGRFGPAFLDQDDHGRGAQDDPFSAGFAQDDHARGAQDDCFPRVSPKMIMVGVVGVRENASWPRILLGLSQDDHGRGAQDDLFPRLSPKMIMLGVPR